MGKRQYRSRPEWSILIDQQEQSGLSVLDFCGEHGLYAKSFYKNRKALGRSPARVRKLVSSSPFVQVQKTQTSAVTDDTKLIILQHRESRLLLPQGIEPQWVAQFLQALS